MSDEFEYGKNIKAIVFEDNDHRHAQLIIKLKHDGFRQAQFFRQIITSYINDDELFLAYIDSIKQHNAKRKAKTQKLREQGKAKMSELGLTENDVEDLFDLIQKEHPEL